MTLDLCLVLVIAVQQWFYMRQVQKLVDKLMSRSYTEYITAQKPPLRVEVPTEAPEDLRSLSEFSIV